MKKLKVLQVVSDSNIGGAGRLILNMLSCFDRDKVESKVILPTKSKLQSEIEKLGVETITLDDFAEASFNFKLVKRFENIFRDEQPDIVHTHASLSARIAAKKLKLKVVYTRHWLGDGHVNFFAKLINNYLCDAAIAVSQITSNSLISTGISEHKINVIHNGIMQIKSYSDIEKKILCNQFQIEDKFIFGTVARLEHVKGIKYFIDAAKQFPHDDVLFYIFGDGSLKDELVQYANSSRIIFKGFAENIEQAVNLFDVFVLPSLQESLSLSLLEAMSAGCACIATNCGGPNEIITHNENGLLVPVKNAEAIAEAMAYLYSNDDERERIGQSAYEHVRQNFDAQCMTDSVYKLYERLVS